jgi:hypothetical protein
LIPELRLSASASIVHRDHHKSGLYHPDVHPIARRVLLAPDLYPKINRTFIDLAGTETRIRQDAPIR